MQKLMLIAVCLLAFSSCKNSLEPTAPDAPISEPSTLNGIWRGTYYGIGCFYSSLIFDTSSSRYLQLGECGYQFYHEFEGSLTWDSVTFTVSLDSYSNTQWYQIHNDTLFVSGDSLFQFTSTYVRTESTPRDSSWLRGVDWTSHGDVSGVNNNWFGGLAVSDSGLFVQIYGDNHIYRLDFDFNLVASIPVGRFRALDAEGPFLWIATDTTIEKRVLGSMNLIKSIDIRAMSHFDTDNFSIFGMAVFDRFIYVSGYLDFFGEPIGQVHVLDTTGFYGWSVSTNSVIKDLAVFNGRLFTTVHGPNFYEISTSLGRAYQTYFVNQYKYSLDLSGIAFHKGDMFLAHNYGHTLTVFRLPIPQSDDGLEK